MQYELMVVVNPKSDSDAICARVEKALKEAMATSVKVTKIGRKTLAYPITRQQEAEYVLFNFEAEGTAIAAVSQRLRLEQEALLRYLIVRTKVSKVSKVSPSAALAGEDKQESKAKVIITTKTAVKTAVKVSKVSKVSKGSKGLRTKGKKGK